MSITWNPWHGCVKYSEGCEHCYVYRIDSGFERDSREVRRNADFDLPVRRVRGEYKIRSGEEVYTCFSSDFFLDDADEWRDEAWRYIAERRDLDFIIFTKRIVRAGECLPEDWGEGYDNVTIGCTCENQKRADERLPVFLSLPIKHRMIICEPLLGKIELLPYLDREKIAGVSCGGESGSGARVCDYEWVLDIRDACAEAGVSFGFHQTGAKFRRDGRIYDVPRNLQQSQAKKANIDLS